MCSGETPHRIASHRIASRRVRRLTWNFSRLVSAAVETCSGTAGAGEDRMTAEMMNALAAEVGAVIGDAVNDSEFADLVDRVAAERMTPALA